MSQERAQESEGRIVAYVEWNDAGIAATSWDQREDVLKEAETIVSGLIRSAGFLLEQTPERVVLAVSVNPNNDDVNLVMATPRVCIRRMVVWEPPRK